VSGQKGLDVRFDVKGHDEIAEVAESFNEMVYHLEKSQGEREKIEERLRQADKLASIGQLAAGVAHEINNPLSIVLGYTKLIMKNPPVDDRIKEDLRVIHKNAEICKKIVEDLLNFARQNKTRYVQADVNETLESVISTMEDKLTESNIAIVRKYDPSVQRVCMDIDKMNQVYTNILMNAHQAIRSSGVITVSTFCDNEKKVVSIIVSDTGSGIPKDIQDKIFEPFFTTKEPGEGTGLGLAVSYGIVHEHGGEITVESKKNEGAIFTIKLPIGDMKS
jgi:signal transduction histidine kinase